MTAVNSPSESVLLMSVNLLAFYNELARLAQLKTPGPGAYSSVTSISRDGFQYYSRYGSSKASRFNPPSSKRFQDLAQKLMVQPGPGQYVPTESLSHTGTYFVAKYRSSLCRTFGKEPREALTSRGTNLKTPGPGTYALPSDFDGSNPKELALSRNLLKKSSVSKSITDAKVKSREKGSKKPDNFDAKNDV